MRDELLASYTEGMTLLYVEDDPVGGAIIKKILEPYFTAVIGAVNGGEGIRLFHVHRPDIIITDLMMPLMDGITMLREIRKSDQKIPVLLMTASLEHTDLVAAINLGVSKFLAKPLRPALVRQAVQSVAREISMEQVLHKARSQEVELLRYRDRYNSSQEELARRKEQHIVRNLLAGLYLPDNKGGGWLVDMVHQPKDIMSGDSYTIRHNRDGSVLVFLADAMGHGLSASVTSMLTASFFNHMVDGCSCSPLGFNHLASRTILYAGRNLLEDEVFSCVIMQLEPSQNRVLLLSCGMPPLLLVRNGVVERVRGTNPPITSFMGQVTAQEFTLDGVSDILLSTDGLSDAETVSGGSYREFLSTDLVATVTASELHQRFIQRCSANDDDVTLVRLIGSVDGTVHRFSSTGTLSGITGMQRQIIECLQAAGACGDRLDALETALTEILLNAFEHGCLRIGADKRRLILAGEYDDLVMSAQPKSGEEINAILTLCVHNGALVARLEITDPGPGRPTGLLAIQDKDEAPCGRGCAMIRRSVNLARRNPQGNKMYIIQTFEEEEL